VFDDADPAASRHTSPRLRMIITYAPVQQRRRSLYATREHRDCQHTGKAQVPEYTRNDPGRKRLAAATRLAGGELHQLRPAACGAVNVPVREPRREPPGRTSLRESGLAWTTARGTPEVTDCPERIRTPTRVSTD
jgi:hypothetical protein